MKKAIVIILLLLATSAFAMDLKTLRQQREGLIREQVAVRARAQVISDYLQDAIDRINGEIRTLEAKEKATKPKAKTKKAKNNETR